MINRRPSLSLLFPSLFGLSFPRLDSHTLVEMAVMALRSASHLFFLPARGLFRHVCLHVWTSTIRRASDASVYLTECTDHRRGICCSTRTIGSVLFLFFFFFFLLFSSRSPLLPPSPFLPRITSITSIPYFSRESSFSILEHEDFFFLESGKRFPEDPRAPQRLTRQNRVSIIPGRVRDYYK